jgi:hypothetical protein
MHCPNNKKCFKCNQECNNDADMKLAIEILHCTIDLIRAIKDEKNNCIDLNLDNISRTTYDLKRVINVIRKEK